MMSVKSARISMMSGAASANASLWVFASRMRTTEVRGFLLFVR
jgi:hypothetical protein